MTEDVVDLILADHRRFEALLRTMRDDSSDRASARSDFSALLVAHSEAEEREVYPRLRGEDAIDEEEAEHGRKEHDEGHAALLDLLEVEDVQSDDFDEALEKVSEKVMHHLDGEERTVLNPARSDVPEQERQELGLTFMQERQRLLDSDCGSIDNVRRLVEKADDDLIPLT